MNLLRARRNVFSSCYLKTRPLHVSSQLQRPHTKDTYSKEVDTTPPADDKIHRVDPQNVAAQKPHEPHKPLDLPPQAKQSEASMEQGAYDSVSMNKPYEMPGKDQRYGGMTEKEGETSHPGEGPEGSQKGGRHPEGKRSS
ncbi:hypothetical protein EYR40_004843 [Pleurotus pulmonarius]|nr:hypothetical protein EYR36_006776 [Pleurotus pulmonarius]KAF4601471.1 hypothetical protein EYR38_006124 [Pleurotus pulmonarius]KAF4601644.1 hypothetical protein EYR40_004843 [Pleurotus pulmonarius]